jgi:prepilin-type processing-associated H-X9-DG protein
MNESTGSPQTSRFAEKSSFWGVLSLLLLLICGLIVFQAIREVWTGVRVWQPGPIGIYRFADICAGVAGVAATAAIVLGILGLVEIHQGAGKVKGGSSAVTGLVTGTLTLLPLLLVLVVAVFGVPGEKKLGSSNNLKELGLAMHLYYEDYGHFPPAVVRDPGLGDRGQPYSWRVALLPYLGQKELFSQYRRDEPWDSPANQAALARMPRVFAAPGDVRAVDGLTHYQVLVGPGTAFERLDLRIRLTDFPRGASETILVVEAADPVPWTKPEDLSYAPNGPMPKVGGLVGNGFHALFADGSVRWIEAERQESALRMLVPRNGR